MAKRTQQVPVLRAQAQFSWAPPSVPSATPTEFAVGLYSNGTVELHAPSPFADLVTGLEWIEGTEAIRAPGGYWSPRCEWNDHTRKHLLLKATNALRRQIDLPPHVMTPDWPGSE